MNHSEAVSVTVTLKLEEDDVTVRFHHPVNPGVVELETSAAHSMVMQHNHLQQQSWRRNRIYQAETVTSDLISVQGCFVKGILQVSLVLCPLVRLGQKNPVKVLISSKDILKFLTINL